MVTNFFLKLHVVKPVVLSCAKKQIWLKLPFLGKRSLAIRKQLERYFKRTLFSVDLKIIFKSTKRLSNFFVFKDKILNHLKSHEIYHYTCTRCHSSYVGLAERHTFVRLCDHMGLSWRTNKAIVGVPTEIKDHLRHCNNDISLEHFKIVANDNNTLNLKIKESLLIKYYQTNLNNNTYSTPIYLF